MPRKKKQVDEKTAKKLSKKLEVYIEDKGITDPRKIAFLKYYFDPLSPTFSNGFQSALQAGFTEQYAKTILSTKANLWIQEYRAVFREALFNRAEIRLGELMMSGSEKVAADMTKFALSTLGKDIYSPKQEEEVNHVVTHRLDEDQMERIAKRMYDRRQGKEKK